MAKKNFSRRGFLNGASAATAGLAAPAMGSAAPPEPCEDAGSVWERPPKQKGNNLNLILLVTDTFRADNLEGYGSKWIECPNLNRLAKDSILFEDFYPEGMPTVPIRRTLCTGRRIVPTYYHRQHEPVQLPGWHDLYNEDITLSETLLEAGYIPALISDIPHLQRPGRNFHRGYRHYEWIRGQERDYSATAPHKRLDVSDIVPDDYLPNDEGLREFLSQYKVNRRRWLEEGESLVELLAHATVRWLRENHQERPFFLHFEAFDPHEPWDPPRRFLEKYLPNPAGPSWIEPPYGNVKVPEEALRRFRANYAGETTCVDHWIGKVLDTIEELGLYENSIVVFLGDHGALLGEQGQFLKGPSRLRTQVTHIPLLIRMPGKKHAGKRVSGFVQIPDLMPTLLSLLDLKSPSRVTGENFWPLVTGETKSLRDHVVSAYGWIACVRDRKWNYSQVWNPSVYERNYPPQLYDTEKDPEELVNVAAKHPDVTKALAAKLRDYILSGEKITRGSFQEKPRGGHPTEYAQDI